MIIVSGPSHGTLAAPDSSNRMLYTPAPGFAGKDVVNFAASDRSKRSNVATLTINVIANTAACGNGTDDDRDGLIDFPNDPGCGSASDVDENNGCPVPGATTKFSLAPVLVEVHQLIKPYSIVYGTLPLTFTSAVPPGGAICRLVSGPGALPVSVRLSGSGLLIDLGTSNTTATVDFLRPAKAIPSCRFRLLDELDPTSVENDCSLNGPVPAGDATIRWASPGFTFRARSDLPFPTPAIPRGALTFYVDTKRQFPLGIKNYAQALRAVETFIHETLISKLPRVDKITVIQDPPAEVQFTADNGASIGFGFGGPYLQSPTNNALVIPNLPDGPYRVTLVGDPGETFHLAISTTDLSDQGPAASQVVQKGTIDAGGREQVGYGVDTTGPKVRLRLVRSRAGRRALRASCSEPCTLAGQAFVSTRLVAKASDRLSRAGSLLLRFRLGHRTSAVRFRVVARDRAGNPTVAVLRD